MAKRKKRTPNQIEFQKQRRRLQQIIRRGEKKGYEFEQNLVPDMPKRVTKKQLEKIKGIKAEQLYNKAVYIDYTTGEIKPAQEQRKYVKELGHKKAVWHRQDRKRVEEIKQQLEQEYIDTYVEPDEPYEEETYSEPELPYYPTLSKIEWVRNAIASLERYVEDYRTHEKMPIEARKQTLLDIFEDTVTMMQDNLVELDNYLTVHEYEINQDLYAIQHASKNEDVEKSFANLARILNMGALSPNQAESMSYMSEYF